MGIYSDARLIWGIPVTSDDNPELWDDEEEDWRELPAPLELRHYGHYEDPDAERAILTHKNMKRYSADCWEPCKVDSLLVFPSTVASFLAAIADAQINVDDDNTTWWLVASVG